MRTLKKRKEKLYAIPRRCSKWQKYFQNNIIYVNTVKTRPFILILNTHVRDSKRYAKTDTNKSVHLCLYLGLNEVQRGILLYLHCLNFEKKIFSLIKMKE